MMLSQTMTRKMKTNNGSSELTKKSPRSDVYEKQSLRREMQVIHLKKNILTVKQLIPFALS